ncbi:DUF1127 domain-containing protein [Pukyongiella litopenaei]|uniref:DUF1127 domain-containing protein n=1 Tax=Pukyongiella litopenaei TaxID=2605946 RepID=A0A2S0MP65_9RHOB|nr:DUF1127 domain-containing protein [Pukyongiella litopenaei]AVO37513.1 DUF1127 domain-containing protein [Pukyongiella litopenaei]
MSIYITREMIASASREGGGDNSKSLVRRLFGSAIRKWRRRKMIAVFDAMDDQLLSDIGLCRGDIRRVVNTFDDRELGMIPLASSADRLEGMTAQCGQPGRAFL